MAVEAVLALSPSVGAEIFSELKISREKGGGHRADSLFLSESRRSIDVIRWTSTYGSLRCA